MTTNTDLDHSRHLLEQLGFEQVPQLLPELVEEGVREELSLLPFLDLVCQREQDFRQERRIRNVLRLSGHRKSCQPSDTVGGGPSE